MRSTCWFSALAIVASLWVGGATAQDVVRWQMNLESARRMAAQTNRPVLVHFWADWCQPCRQMDQEVFSRPEVAAALEQSFVPVKLNAEYFPHTAQQYGVTLLPTDVILSPDGQVLGGMSGAAGAAQYLARLNQIASRYAGQRPPEFAPQAVPASPYYAAAAPPDSAEAGRNAPGIRIPPAADLARNQTLSAPPPVQAATPSPEAPPPGAPSPPAVAAAIQLPPGNPPLGLDGYCPVELSENQRWVLGDPRWGLIHQGRTYLFAGPEQRDRFDANPDRYAPVYAGNDVVLAVERGQTVPGRREHGAWYQDRVYLFSSEATLMEFDANPQRYLGALAGPPQDVARRPGYGVPPAQQQPAAPAASQNRYAPWH